MEMSRRYFLSTPALVAGLGQLEMIRLNAADAPLARRFFMDLSCGRIGLKATFLESIDLAEGRRLAPRTFFRSRNFSYLQNFRSHAYRLRACAQILKDHGQKLGLEYLGPMTLWRRERHAFIHSLNEMKELIAAIGTGNVGIQLDSWHWFTADETEADLLTLRNEDIITVDLNDAPQGIALDKQIDSARELPAVTGVIPIKAFLDALRKIGYDGPVHAEPFNAALRALPREEACAATSAAMKKAFAL